MGDNPVYGHVVRSPVTSTMKPNKTMAPSLPLVNISHSLKNNGSEVKLAASPGRHSAIIFLTFLILAFMVYSAIYLWRKRGHRLRRIPKLYKLEGYRYSRLNQNENEGDSSIIANDHLGSRGNSTVLVRNNLTEEEKGKPATLQIESDSLINLSNHSSFSPIQKLLNSTDLEMDASDEDLLQ